MLKTTQFPFVLFKLKNKESWVLYIAMFVLGACGLAYEYTLSKVAGDILGNSVRQWAIIIGVMMFFMGVGADLQKYFPDRYLFDFFVFWEIVIGLAGAFGPLSYIYFYGQFPMHFVLVKYFFIILIGLIIGFEIPIISRINEQFIHELKLNLAAVLKMDYIGSLAGALIWIFLLPLYFEQIQAAFVLGLLNLLVGGFTLFFFRKWITQKAVLTLLLLGALIAVLSGLVQAKKWRSDAEQYLYRDRIVFSETTRYQHIVVTKSRSGDISCYINGHLQFNSVDEFIYHETMVHPVFHIASRKQNILILGGGDGLALREVLKYKEVKKVVLCDLDPEMTRLASENDFFIKVNNNSFADARLMVQKNNALIPADSMLLMTENQNIAHARDYGESATVEIINIDAIEFVEQVSGIFDIIILDFPDPNSTDLAKLYALQFYQQIKKKLAADGFIIQQATSPYHAKELFLSIGRTIDRAGFSTIPIKENVPTFGEWGWWIAAKNERISSATLKEKISSIKELEVETRFLSADVLRSALIFGKEQLNSKETAVNSLTNNMAYLYYLKSWQN